MVDRVNVNSENLRMLCWQRGFEGVVGLARHIKRSRVTIHRAIRWPDQYGPTVALIHEALKPPTPHEKNDD